MIGMFCEIFKVERNTRISPSRSTFCWLQWLKSTRARMEPKETENDAMWGELYGEEAKQKVLQER